MEITPGRDSYDRIDNYNAYGVTIYFMIKLMK